MTRNGYVVNGARRPKKSRRENDPAAAVNPMADQFARVAAGAVPSADSLPPV